MKRLFVLAALMGLIIGQTPLRAEGSDPADDSVPPSDQVQDMAPSDCCPAQACCNGAAVGLVTATVGAAVATAAIVAGVKSGDDSRAGNAHADPSHTHAHSHHGHHPHHHHLR